jgi:RNA recognition motif-containing protein
MNIYVGNLPFSATEDEVQEVFAAFGQVTSVTLIKDKFTGQPRGFGFVEMPTEDEAQKAIQALNGKDFKNRSLVVNPARPREERSGFRQGGGFSDQRRPSGGGGERRGGNRSQDRKRRDDW